MSPVSPVFHTVVTVNIGPYNIFVKHVKRQGQAIKSLCRRQANQQKLNLCNEKMGEGEPQFSTIYYGLPKSQIHGLIFLVTQKNKPLLTYLLTHAPGLV